MMQLIRSNAGKFMTIIIVGGFLAWMVYGIGMEVSGSGGRRPGELGSVNGTPITIEAWQREVQQLQDQARQQGAGQLTAEEQKQIEDRAWNNLVDQILMQKELDRRGIRVTDDEIRFAAMNVPAPQMMQQEIFQTNGQFDINKYRQYLSSPQASDELLAQLEQYYRAVIPESKLREQIGSGTWIPDAQLWRMFRDRNETATVEYVELDLSKLAPQTPAVSDDEVQRYYDEHKDEFKRPRTARFTVAALRTAPDNADREQVLAHAQQLRQQLAAGGDFAAIARTESADTASARQGGSLGTVRHGQMVAPFDSAVWALPVNEISQPVLTQFGYHLVQVTARGGDTAVVRHILLPIKKSDAELESVDAKSDTLGREAEAHGIERAARSVGAQLRQGVTVSDNLPYIPGVGPAMEALNWASGEARDLKPGDRPVSDVMDGEQAVYVVRLDSYLPAGQMTVAEARPQITSQLILQKKRERARAAGEKIVAAVRHGQSLQQAAAAYGLTVQTAGPFSRVEGNTALGQASQAVGAAFGTPVGQVSGVVESPGGLFIVRPTARTAADPQHFAEQKEQMRMMLSSELRQRAVPRWLDSLRKSANIKDNRDKVLGRA
jgi:peptidyl-prolyl cis-trans isomerase D